MFDFWLDIISHGSSHDIGYIQSVQGRPQIVHRHFWRESAERCCQYRHVRVSVTASVLSSMRKGVLTILTALIGRSHTSTGLTKFMCLPCFMELAFSCLASAYPWLLEWHLDSSCPSSSSTPSLVSIQPSKDALSHFPPTLATSSLRALACLESCPFFFAESHSSIMHTTPCPVAHKERPNTSSKPSPSSRRTLSSSTLAWRYSPPRPWTGPKSGRTSSRCLS
jgi:hypothetical protein